MKLKNVLMTVMAIISLLFGETVSALAKTPNSFMVDGDDTYKINVSKYLPEGGLPGYNIYYKVNSSGLNIYCVQRYYYAVTSGVQKYTYGYVKGTNYAYILENGYPNKSITGDKEKDYLITALAVYYTASSEDHLFKDFDFDKGTFKGIESDVVKEVAKLLNGSKNHSYVTPSIKLNVNNNFILSSDKKYYVSSNNISVTGNVRDYNVSLENVIDGTIVTDKNGNVKNTFAANETFMIKVPVNNVKNEVNEFKVNVTATGVINKAYLYRPQESKYQDVIALYPDEYELNDSGSVKLNVVTEVQISKVDATTSKELPGAKLTVKDSAGKVVDTWTSTNEVHVIKGLKAGKYILTEEIAPEGYVLSKETITFEVKLDGSVTKVVMKNSPEEKEPIYISKKDITTGEELAGAHLELKDEKGNLIEAWVSQDTPHMVEELKPGKYYLTEVIAPMGYELSKETVEFTVKEDRTVDGEVVMYNKPETIVDVPKTASFKTITSSLIGIVIIGLGSMIIYRSYKKNEEV